MTPTQEGIQTMPNEPEVPQKMIEAGREALRESILRKLVKETQLHGEGL
jgi:hypothetical protein